MSLIFFWAVYAFAQCPVKSVRGADTARESGTISNSTTGGSPAVSRFPGALTFGNQAENTARPTLGETVKYTSAATLRVADKASEHPHKPFRTGEGLATCSGISLSTPGNLTSGGKTYCLTTNISCSATCFGVMGNNITVDLNGHSITYGTGQNSVAVAAFLGVYCWDPIVQASGIFGRSAPCGGPFNNFTVTNSTGTGLIQEGAGPNGPYSTPIYMSQNVSSGPNVNHVTLTFKATAAYGIYTNYAGGSATGGGSIHDVVCNNNSTTIVSRYDIENACIKLDQGANVKTGFKIGPNVTQNGGVQASMVLNLPRTEVKHNTIKLGYSGQTAGYTNDYAIYLWAKNLRVRDNTVDNLQGRGLEFYAGDNGGPGASGSVAQNNNVTVIEHANNTEYGGCEISGAFGVNFKTGPQNTTFGPGNIVTAKSSDCAGIGLRVVGPVLPGELSTGNFYIGSRIDTQNCSPFSATEGSCGYGFSFESNDSINDVTFTSQNDTFTGDTADGWIDWNGCAIGTYNLFLSSTFRKGSNPMSNFVFISYNNGGGPCVIHFRDATFGSGVSPTSTDMHAIDSNHQFAQYFIDWTYTLTLTRSSGGSPIRGATVTSTDRATGAQDCNATTDAHGVAGCVFTQFDMKNSSSRAQIHTSHNPHAVTISATGCTTLSYSLSITGTTSDSRTLTCP